MPSATLSRLKSRIGDMGLPSVVWVVYTTKGAADSVAFYDREKAEQYAAATDERFVSTRPLKIMDAGP